MKTDLTNAIKKYKKTSIYNAINEALVNSIQAGATKIRVNIKSSCEMLDGSRFVSEVSIEDNGDGFNKENRKSFLTYLSSYKQKEYGCQGMGRLSYLKSFKEVSVSSKQNKELVEFDFTTELNDEILEPKPIEENIKKTIINLREPKAYPTVYNLDKAYQEIYNHMYPFIFLCKKECEIVINDDKKITRDDLENIEELKVSVTKKINNQEDSAIFTLWYRFNESEKAVLDDFLCVNNRPMKRFSKEPLKIKLNKKEGYHITLLIESDWINKRYDIEIEEEEEESKQESMFIEWSDVGKEMEKAVNKLLNEKFPELATENAKKIKDLKEKYPHYADYIENSSVGFVDEKQILDNAYKKARVEEQKLDKNASIEDIQKCVSNDLIRYILHRQEIINKLQSLENTKIEKEVHNLFLEQGLEGAEERQVPLDKNNLWLLDDKFMSYSYIASEKTIHKFLETNNLKPNASDQRLDIILYFDKQEKNKACIIELKKLTANYKEKGVGIDQLFNYSKKLFESGTKELYLYLFAEIDDDFRDSLENKEGFRKIFSHEGELWQNSYLDRNSYIQIISPNAIIADANARNKTFLDIIIKSKLAVK